MASATTATSGPRHSTSALEARSMRGLRRDTEGSQVAETGSETHDLSPRFSHGRSDVRIHFLSRLHIGGAPSFFLALPPHFGGTPPKHKQVHSLTTPSV